MIYLRTYSQVYQVHSGSGIRVSNTEIDSRITQLGIGQNHIFPGDFLFTFGVEDKFEVFRVRSVKVLTVKLHCCPGRK